VQTGPRIYNLFPLLAGPIDRWAEHLPRIAGMGFDWIYLNPIEYPGFSGSLYAVKDPTELHPLVRGDSTAPAEDLVRRFTDAAAGHGLKVMADLVINHTAKDALLVDEHPEWFRREEDGSIRSPRAVDADDPRNVTVWGDLAEIDYLNARHRETQMAYWTGIARRQIEAGFKGFRCDAAYQVPAEIWKPLIDACRAPAPDCLFCAETLGCTPQQVIGLADAGFDYLFNSSKWWDFEAPWLLQQYEQFRTIAPSIAFPESHDTERLAAEFPDAPAEEVERRYRLRYLFACVFSSGVMCTTGYEYGFAKRVNVVDSRAEDWAAEAATPRFDLTGFIAAANRMKAETPVLNVEGPQQLVAPAKSGLVGLLRLDEPTVADARHRSIALINPGADRPREIAADGLLTKAGVDALPEVTPDRPPETLEPGRTVSVAPLECRVFAQ
jgi:starch synthase (maltosyl-transferring)